MVVKLLVACGLGASLALTLAPTPVPAQEGFNPRLLTDVCLPYVNRQQGFERSMRVARDLKFRRPVDDRAALEEWASEVEMVSRNGVWRVRLEENTIDVGDDRQAYAVTCSISSTRASVRDLSDLGRRAFNNPQFWTTSSDQPPVWTRRSSDPEARQLQARVTDDAGAGPRLVIQGLYF